MQRLPDWERSSVDEVVKVVSAANKVDWDCCWHKNTALSRKIMHPFLSK